MAIGNVLKLAEEAIGEGLREHRSWYNTKYYRRMILQSQRDADVRKLIKGNDDLAYTYVAVKGCPIRKGMQVNRLGVGDDL